MQPDDWTLARKLSFLGENDRQALEPGREVSVYGSGSIAREVLDALKARGLRLRHLIDGNTTRTDVEGIPIRRPDDPTIAKEERAAQPLLLGLFNREVDLVALGEKLEAWGWTWRIDFVDLHAAWPGAFPDHYWLTSRHVYAEHAGEIARADALWSDGASRELYRQILDFRLTGRRTALVREFGRQYFLSDLPPWKTPLRFIDVGAYDGDTLRSAIEAGVKLEAVVALEPDLANYAKLVASAREVNRLGSIEFSAWPCGAWKQTASLRFASGAGEASSIGGSAGDTVIQGVALDDVLPDFRPTLIKLDIEGAEPEALEGARRLIERSHCGLAVCVYHRPTHLWEIPLLIADWNLGYRFYLRVHGQSGFDLVLYAIPIQITNKGDCLITIF